MQTLTEEITHKLQQLSELELKEILEFIEFISNSDLEENGEDDPILSVMGILPGEPMSAEEIENDLYGEYNKIIVTNDQHFIQVGKGFIILPS